jgi:hypothetical protein
MVVDKLPRWLKDKIHSIKNGIPKKAVQKISYRRNSKANCLKKPYQTVLISYHGKSIYAKATLAGLWKKIARSYINDLLRPSYIL